MPTKTVRSCSVCGAALGEPDDATASCCPSCLAANSPLASEIGTAEGAVGGTVVCIVPDGADDDMSMSAPTIDYVPGYARAAGSTDTSAKTVGRFQIQRVLGRGSFGVVYQARDPLLDRQVALKVPRFAPDDAEMLERFLREAKAAARLRHPNIVAVFESGQTDEFPYIVSEFVDGVPLAEVLEKRPPDMRTAVDWVRQVAEALEYAHSEGIVHRDIKPANIMLSRTNRPQVMDFGLAKRDADQASGMTTEGAIMGTPAYMAPEQARGEIQRIGPLSDQYSVGVMLYEMLCGRRPYGGDPLLILSSVASMREAPPTLRSVKGEIPRDLEACCLKAMEKEPQARYPSLQAFATDLDHWLKGLPLVARPLSLRERLVRWCRKNRLISGLVASLAVLVVAAAIVGNILAFKFQSLATIATNEARDARDARELEKRARLSAEQVLVDTFTETGLTADRNGDPHEAILWFANAVATAGNHPERERHNRIRLQSWLPEIALPVQVFEPQPPEWSKALSYHPSGRVLLRLSLSGDCALFNLVTGERVATPFAGPVAAALWSPDGTQLAVATDREVVLSAFPTNTPLDRWTHPDKVSCLQFSADGQWLVVAGEKSMQVRDVRKKSSRTRAVDLESPAAAAEISSDGRHVAVRCDDQQVRVFSTAPDPSGADTPWPPLPSAAAGLLSPMFVAQDRLVVVNNNDAVRCYDLATRKTIWEQKVQRVLSTATSPDGKWIALGEDFDLVLLDAKSGEPVGNRIAHRNLINGISFHPQRPWVLTASVDHTAKIFEIPSGKPVGPPIPHTSSVHRCAWSPDGTTFATVQWDGQLIRAWRPGQEDTGGRQMEKARGPFVRFNRAGDRWMPVGFDNGRDRAELQVMDAGLGKAHGPTLRGPGLISDADFVGESPLIVLVGGGTVDDAKRKLQEQNLSSPGFVRFVNSETGRGVFPDIATTSQPIAVRTSRDAKTVVVLCHRGHVMVLDAATGKPRTEQQGFRGMEATHGFIIRDRIRFSPSGEQFLLWGCESSAELRQTVSGKLLFEFRHEASSFIHDAQFSPDGRLVATCSSDSMVRLWNTSTGEANGRPLNHSGWIFSAQFSHDGSRLLTASRDHHARIWDLAQGTAVLATRRHNDEVFGVNYLPGEELFIVSTRDGQITAWDATFGKRIAPVRRMPGEIYQLSRSEVGSQVIASGNFSPIRTFDWKEWILDPDRALSRDDARLLGEIASVKRVHEGGAATSLTSAEWFERWQRFRAKHPDNPVLAVPALKPTAKASDGTPH